MPYFILIFLIFCFTSFAYSIDIDEGSSNLSILNKSSIFVDKTNNLSLHDIKKQNFITNNLINLNLGYKPTASLWIKFSLHNKTGKLLKKTLEFAYKQTESVTLYTDIKILKGGFLHYDKNRKSLKPSFLIELNANESQTYYLEVKAKIKPLRATIKLWNEVDFIKYNLTDKMYRFILLGMIVVLFIYNTMILLFTREKAYLYYVLYLLSLMLLTNYYSGIISYYLLSPTLAILAIKLHTTSATIYLLFCILFTQEFLKTKQFKNLHRLLNLTLYLLPILGILSYNNWFLNSNTATFLVLIGVVIVYSGFHALSNGVQEAKYYVLGWTLMLLSFTLFAFQGLGLYSLKDYPLSYLLETTFVIEALLFSIALAHKIKITNEAKVLSDAKLIAFQEEEKKDLNSLVSYKTNELKYSLNQKEILYKELNHRVKNNFMMILSLLKLQISRSKLIEIKDSLKITENRIRSIANLYDMLILNNENININTHKYLKKIYNNVGSDFKREITIHYDIQYNIDIDSLIYVGLVFNELITNSLNYAFPLNSGEIFVTLKREKNKIFFHIEDNGQGFTKRAKNSLGLTIVEILIEGQLSGELTINSDKNGTKVFMSWILEIK